MKVLAYLKDSRGLTLIELMVTITIAIVVLAPVYEVLLTGNRVQVKSFGQVEIQEKTQQVLNQLVEGKINGSSKVGGLREAGQNQIAIDPVRGIAFVSSGRLVTYYFINQKIYYLDQVYSNQPVQVNDISLSGNPLLDDVQSFSNQIVMVEGKKMYQISINAGKRLASGGKKEITLTTEVRPRN